MIKRTEINEDMDSALNVERVKQAEVDNLNDPDAFEAAVRQTGVRTSPFWNPPADKAN